MDQHLIQTAGVAELLQRLAGLIVEELADEVAEHHQRSVMHS